MAQNFWEGAVWDPGDLGRWFLPRSEGGYRLSPPV